MRSPVEDQLCSACRLLQARAPGCRFCGTALIALEWAEFVLYQMVHRLRVENRSVHHAFSKAHAALIVVAALFIVGAAVGVLNAYRPNDILLSLPAIPLFVAVSYLLARFMPSRVRRKRLSALHLAPPRPVRDAETVRGVAHGDARVAPFLPGAPALALFFSLHPQGAETIFLRTTRNAGFLLVNEERRIQVAGELWLSLPAPQRPRCCDDRASLEQALEQRVLLPAALEGRQWQLATGDRLELVGRVTREAAALPSGGYRDGFVDTLRGTPENPVLVRVLTSLAG